MNNKIEYQILLDIKDNLQKASDSLGKYVSALDYAAKASLAFGTNVTNSLQAVSNAVMGINAGSSSLQQLSSDTDTVASRMQQFQNQVDALKLKMIELGGSTSAYFVVLTELIPGINVVCNTYSDIAKAISSSSLACKVASMAQSAYTSAVTIGGRALYIYQMQVLTAKAAISSTTGVTKLLNMAIAASPYMIAAAAAMALGVAIYKLATNNDAAGQAHKRLNATMADMNKEVATEQAKLDALFTPLNLAKEGTEEWNSAKEKIVAQYGDYLNKVGVEIKDVNSARMAYNQLSKAILDTARSRAMDKATTGAAEAYGEKEADALKNIREKLYKGAGSGKINYSDAGKAFGQIRDAIRSGKDIPEEAKNILDKFRGTMAGANGVSYEDNPIANYINNQVEDTRKARTVFENEMAEARATLGGASDLLSSPSKSEKTNSLVNLPKVDIKIEPNSIADLKQQLSDLEKQMNNTTVGTASVDIQVKINKLKSDISVAEDWIEKNAFIKTHGEITVPLSVGPTRSITNTIENHGYKAPEISKHIAPLDFGTKDIDLEKPLTNLESWNTAVEAARSNNANLLDGMGAMGTAFGNIGELIGGAAGKWLEWGANCIQAIGQAIPQILALCGIQTIQAEGNSKVAATGAASAMSSIPFVGPVLAIAAVASVLAALAAIPFANGGLISGPTLALMGEYAGASNNPEVVAPLNKLRSLLQPASGMGGEVSFRIEGRTLVGIMNKMNGINQRTR